MSAIAFTITDAGTAALANAGTLGPVTISQVALGSANYTPSSSQTALETPIKSLTPSGSTVPTPGTIHITATDSSSDAYNVGEIGLITSTGVLFAVYSQSTPILVKSASSVGLFALDLVVTGADPSSITVGDTGFAYPAATQTMQGVAAIATTALVTAGTDDQTIVTPLKLNAFVTAQIASIDFSPYVAKAGATMTGPLALAADPTTSAQAATKNYVDTQITEASASNANIYVPQSTLTGMVGFFPIVTSPTDWLIANGAAVSRITYAGLFAVLGTTFGTGDGATTFNLPDLRGEFIRCWDDGRGVDSGRGIGSWQAGSFVVADNGSDSLISVLGSQNVTGNNLDTITNWTPYSGAGVNTMSIGGGTQTFDTGASTTLVKGSTRPRNIALAAFIHI